MARVQPFAAVVPDPAHAQAVIAPPYDVLSEDQARSIAEERRSFVRVTRSEVDLEPGTDPHSDAAYRQARTTLDAFLADGLLRPLDDATYLFYGQAFRPPQRPGQLHRQVGILAAASVAEYDDGRIAKHEFTRPDKEDDRTHHMDVLDAQVGLVFLAYRPTDALDAITERVTAGEPAWRVTTEDGVEHTLWVAPAAEVPAIEAAFAEIPRLYIADGHHRSAAASRIHAQRQDTASEAFLAGLYPSDRLLVMAYNRIVHDLNGHTEASFLERIREQWAVTPDATDTPTEKGDFRMRLGGRWYALSPRTDVLKVDESDPVATLDVALLQDHLLGPVLGIDDPRRSTRITFVGGIHGAAGLVDGVQAREAGSDGPAVAFHLFPTGLDELFAVADAGEVMPPKSTWFEPKLREGVAVRLLR
jgi:uncharacterized protein (DUF1015 family)